MAIRQEKICTHLGFGQASIHGAALAQAKHDGTINSPDVIKKDSFINDSIYLWDDQHLDWIAIGVSLNVPFDLGNAMLSEPAIKEPIEVQWEQLESILYRLRYFDEIGAGIFAPVFGDKLEHLHGKEVVIEGHLLPLDGTQEMIALSLNPYASCFFCGNASPASVMSLDLEEKGKKYKMDDFKKFQGILHLNRDDPNQFYYILEHAKEL